MRRHEIHVLGFLFYLRRSAFICGFKSGYGSKNSVGFRLRRVLIIKEIVTDDTQLLRSYTEERAEPAFGELAYLRSSAFICGCTFYAFLPE